MSGVVDSTRRFVVDGTPVAKGILTVADAHSCTNPSIGRGITIGLRHTVVARDAVRVHLDDPVALALAFDAATIVRDGHEPLRAVVRHRRPRGRWREEPLVALGNDRYRGAFTVDASGRHRFEIEAWGDRHAGWLD